MRITPLRAATAAIALIAGFGMAASAVTARGTDLRGGRSGDLRDLVIRQSEQLNAATPVLERLRTSVAALAAEIGGPDLTEALDATDALSPAVGLTRLEGPGVIVTLDDAPKTNDASIDPDSLVIHQQDVQAVVNALWRGGAEGIMVMDQRLIATSAVKCVGNTLLLQGHVYSPPYKIQAVGEPAAMEKALDIDAGVQLIRDFARVYGIGYSVTTQSVLKIPAYSGAVSPVNASTI